MKKKAVESKGEKFLISKETSEFYFLKLQSVVEKTISCLSDINTSEVEEVARGNEIIGKVNALVEEMNLNFNLKISPLRELFLTDTLGNPLKEFHIFIVGEKFTENGDTKYGFCRYVNARTEMEALYKYRKVYTGYSNFISCLGLKETDDTTYGQYIENKDIIE